jgi:hypothetical protein
MHALMLLALLLTACETTWPEGASIASSSGQRLCAKHRIPLVALHAYEAQNLPGYVILGPHEASRPYYGVAEQYCPNHVPEHVSLVRVGIMRRPTTVYYCTLCEKEMLERLRVPDEKTAREFAQYVLTLGDGHVATKPPYDISLRGDVWTVSCFLVDGRKATIKFSKETGRLIWTKYGE